MVEAAEKLLSELRETLPTLEASVTELESLDSETPPFAQKLRTTSELITQALLKLDNLQISKDAAASALRSGERQKTQQMAVLLARRKTLIKKLNALGERVDAKAA